MQRLAHELTATPRRHVVAAFGAVLLIGGLGAAMWVWTVIHISRDVELERSGVRVTATVLAFSWNGGGKSGSEELSFQLPDGTAATQWTGSITSRQAPGGTLAAVYLPGRPETIEAVSYLRWWWVGAVVMPVLGTAFGVAGVFLLFALVRRIREGALRTDRAAAE
ncbi:DUF3592 domain-containing protein [Actinocrinis sp.]|uniref:DUF3592 domain-containing protein n=1 Tax=Actinocrinis sp. TaxID=1920516 RepID=UPI002D648B0B|nr:hypothetical protein [Actinocrinis sp.]HZP54396.1 hypothetical protein [Actinocrinis sp.]